MAKQTINPGTAPTGAGGDTFRSGSAKLQANDDEIYNYLGDGTNLNKLGTAAFKNTGTQAGNVMEVGAFGLGGNSSYSSAPDSINKNGFYHEQNGVGTGSNMNYKAFVHIQHYSNSNYAWQIGVGMGESTLNNLVGRIKIDGVWSNNFKIYNSSNASVDSNGFIKAASPIVKLFADKIELNDEAEQQDISFEKLGVGNYLIKGSSGFAQEGWYVETPKDANGNVLVAVVYEQLENGDISVKTYDYMLNKKGRIVADTETPLDIPENRWIDIRLQALPPIEYEIPTSKTPADFQPTGIAQAVATVMESYHDPEQ